MSSPSMSSIDSVLEELKLQYLIGRFHEEKVEISDIQSLTDGELNRLGVTTIGDRVRLREKVTELTKRDCSSHQQTPSTSRPSAPEQNELGVDHLRRQRNLLFSRSSTSRKRKDVADPDKCVQVNKRSYRGWTVSVMCLSDKNSTRVPTADEKELLLKAGLGLKKMKFGLMDGETEVIQKLSSDETDENDECLGFPQLKTCGGFELMRSQSNSRILTLIDIEWSVRNLKACIGSQGKLYIRPIQMNLSTESKKKKLESTKSLATETCKQCGDSFSMAELRAHCQSCVGESNETKDEKNEQEINTPDAEETDDLPDPLLEPATNSTTYMETTAAISASSELVFFMDEPSFSNNLADREININHDTEDLSTEDVQPVSIIDTATRAVQYCTAQQIQDPVDILRYLQSVLVIGRKLDIDDPSQPIEGQTNYICVDRSNILTTAFEEIKAIDDLRFTLEVQFYGEVAADYGGPRKEFFQLALMEIKEKYFDHGIREHLAEDYTIVGKILALSILQNGKLPRFFDEELHSLVFSEVSASSRCITNLRAGLDSLGLYTVGVRLPMFRYLLQPSTTSITVKALIQLLHPKFAEEGSNTRRFENIIYATFMKYLREIASGRRGTVSLQHVLQFTTGTPEEPVLGFTLHPSIDFVEAQSKSGFIPTANTCINTLRLPRPTSDVHLPSEEELFRLYDYAFMNTFYGLY
ncbi:uncharacterized protein LOC133181305 [Saccostrea echinata]|uniref:uncharacterized protein LOC133181305 n=1 Tax=Saccostrea echinata TaxID=191078 RepID=UPI002A818C34|nr:uncharacterized protein LOC133181305 [Saccostrea echinata]